MKVCLYAMEMQVSVEARSRLQLPWSWGYRQFWPAQCGFLAHNMSLWEKQEVLLAIEPSLQPQITFIYGEWCTHCGTHVRVREQIWDLFLSIHHVATRVQNQIGGQCLSQTSHLPNIWQGRGEKVVLFWLDFWDRVSLCNSATLKLAM